MVAGDKPLSGYVRANATKLRDTLVESGLAGSSVARLFTTVKSIFNFTCMETGLEIKNPFAGLYLDREQGVSVRKPIPVPVIKRVQAECVRSDDPLRWAAALLSDAGIRTCLLILPWPISYQPVRPASLLDPPPL